MRMAPIGVAFKKCKGPGLDNNTVMDLADIHLVGSHAESLDYIKVGMLY